MRPGVLSDGYIIDIHVYGVSFETTGDGLQHVNYFWKIHNYLFRRLVICTLSVGVGNEKPFFFFIALALFSVPIGIIRMKYITAALHIQYTRCVYA